MTEPKDYRLHLEEINRFFNSKQVLTLEEVSRFTGKSKNWCRQHLSVSHGTTAVKLALELSNI